jgi:hypothetical protein
VETKSKTSSPIFNKISYTESVYIQTKYAAACFDHGQAYSLADAKSVKMLGFSRNFPSPMAFLLVW